MPAYRKSVVAVVCLAAVALGAARCGSSQVTFNKDVAPIVFANCAPCHRPGESAPFTLLNYADVAKHADGIVEETGLRHMPPWLPERGEFPIAGERRLSAEQIDTIQRWVKGGKLEGNAKDLPKAPVWTEGWQLGQPDEVVTAERPFLIKPGGDDVYRDLVLHTTLKAGTFVRAVEFKTNGAPIHHAVIRVDRTTTSRRRDGEDGQPGFDGMSWQNVQDPDGQFIGWAPGRGPIVSPEGMPWRLEKGADLVVEVHVIPTEKAVSVQPTIGLFFTDTPPVRSPITVKMGSKRIDIPAGQADYVVSETYELPVDVDLLSVYPHAHYLGKDMLVTAAQPNGQVKTLIHIKKWSFHWQQDYRYLTPIPLPAGTKLTMRYTYDNSEQNNENPHKPPVRVRLGPRSTDEMGDFLLQVLAHSENDGLKVVEAFEERDKLANVALAETRVRDEPANAENQAVLGGSYVEMGRFAEALGPLQTALRLKNKDAGTYNYLGVALMALDRVGEAVPQFRRAAELAPRDERMQFNLGNALAAVSQSGEAAAAYERALVINPDYPDAHVNLGVLLFSRGRIKEAIGHYQRAAELLPDSSVIHNNLGGALAAAGRYQEALQHVQRALQLDPTYAPALDNLKRLQQLGIK